jgi:predicted NUDIX family NTP pyrophosphohydrolase
MPKTRQSAGLLMYRFGASGLELFLAHPGGPFFQNRDAGVWSIPKGVPNDGEELIAAAEREFFEEVGLKPHGPYMPLGQIKQKGGKIVHAWAFEGNWTDDNKHVCNTFKMEWPPQSGKTQEFQEIDQVGFFPLDVARVKLKETQWPLVERLWELLSKN